MATYSRWLQSIVDCLLLCISYHNTKHYSSGPCIADSAYVRTNDNITYPISFSDCWTLVSGHCGPTPSYAVFTKKVSGSKPLALKAYIGGHSNEINAASGSVVINGSPVTLEDDKEYEHKEGTQEIFK